MQIHGFELVRERALPWMALSARQFRHGSGLEVLSLESDSAENLFALCFATEPEDDCGTPHILEHCVLGGSAKYPLKDPFIEMVKSSLATFINAMTDSDKTVYPASSCHRQDFFNLLSVYWDAVYHPRLSRLGFMQEGWHYELGGGELRTNGIVLNEMRGVYSELETVFERGMLRHLLPETPLARESGGHPEAIPSLSYAVFCEYYRRHYCLANTRLLFLGNIPTEEKLCFVAGLLAEGGGVVSGAKLSMTVERQRPWSSPRCVRQPVAPEEEGGGGAVGLGWLLRQHQDAEADLVWQLLDYALLGHAGSPLSKALLESGLGSAQLGQGYDNNTRECLFTVGLRGVSPEDFVRVEGVILDCLRGLVAEGIGQERVQAALRQLKLESLEVTSEQSLDRGWDVLTAWVYDSDPLLFLGQQGLWGRLEECLAEQPRLLEGVIERDLLGNPHCLRLELEEDGAWLEGCRAQLRQRLAGVLQGLSEAERVRIVAEEQELKRYQEEADSVAALASLPRLRRSDLPLVPPPLPAVGEILGNRLPLQVGTCPDPGLAYVFQAYDLSSLPMSLRGDLGLFVLLFSQVGKVGQRYDRMSERWMLAGASRTLRLEAGQSYPGGSACRAVLLVGLRALRESLAQALGLWEEERAGKVFVERQRIHEVLRQRWSSYLSDLQEGGQYYAGLRASASASPVAAIEESWHGQDFMRQVKRLKGFRGGELEAALENVEAIAVWLRQAVPVQASAVGSSSSVSEARAYLGGLAGPGVPGGYDVVWPGVSFGRRELLVAGHDVGTGVRCWLAPSMTDVRGAALHIYSRLLSCGYLWEAVRLRQGAYGVDCRYCESQGTLTMQSGDDPGPLQSLQIFAEVAGRVDPGAWHSAEIDAGIMACARSDERPWTPWQVGRTAVMEAVLGYPAELRQIRRQALLEQSPESVARAVRSYWEEYGCDWNECVAGPVALARQSGLQPLEL